MRKIPSVIALCVLALLLSFSVRASQAQDTRPPDDIEEEVLLPINRDWFPADRYPDAEWEGMVLPAGDLPVCQDLHPEWFDEDIARGIDNSRPNEDELQAAATCKMASIRGRPSQEREGIRSGLPIDRLRAKLDQGNVKPAAVEQSGLNYRYAINGILCTLNPNPCSVWDRGFDLVYVVHSPYKPTITSGSQSQYHFGNRTHVGGVPNGAQITCQDGLVTDPNVAAGLHWGAHADFTYYGTGMLMFWERFGTNACHGYSTGVIIAPSSSSILFRFQATNVTSTGATWTMYAWLNGAWAQIGQSNVIVAQATFIESGLEIYSGYDNSFGGISVPLNFMHKAMFNGDGFTYGPNPWHDETLPSRYYNKSTNIIDSPWGVFDANSWNWTSIAAKAN